MIVEQRKSMCSARYARLRSVMVNDKTRRNRDRVFSREARKTRKTHVYTCTNCAQTYTTHIHTHAGTRLYTAYKMNARRHTLDLGDRTKLATGIFLTYRQIGLPSPCGCKNKKKEKKRERDTSGTNWQEKMARNFD